MPGSGSLHSRASRSSALTPDEEALLDVRVDKNRVAYIISSSKGTEIPFGFAIFGRKDGRSAPKGDIVFLHGTPGSRLDAAYLDDAASALGLRIVSIDRPGTGMSGEQPLRKIIDFSQDLQKLLRAMEPPVLAFYLIAHSAGAAYAMALVDIWPPGRLLGVAIVAGLAPRRIAERHLPKQARDLLHTATYGRPEDAQKLVDSQAALWTQESAQERYQLMKEVLKSSTEDYEALAEPRMARIWLQSQYEAYKNTSRRNGLLTEASLLWTDWNIPLGKIQYKGIRFYYGSEDTTTNPKMGKAFARQVPHSKLIIYKGTGHYSILITCGVRIIQDLLEARRAREKRPVRLLEHKPSWEPRRYSGAEQSRQKVVYKYDRR